MLVGDVSAYLHVRRCHYVPTLSTGTVDAVTEVDDATALVAGARRVTVLTGAGISTDSGIPDFRGPNGLWTKDPKAERTSNIEYYVTDPEVRRLAWQGRLRWVEQPREPN